MSAGAEDAGGDLAYFHFAPDPAMPGWWTWDVKDTTRFNGLLGPLRVRAEGDRHARLRMTPARKHSNIIDGVHGGALMALIDIALFATCRVHNRFDVGHAATIDCSVQFVGPAWIDRPVDAVSEVLRETGRLVFLRGLIVQGEDADETVCVAYSGTIRKPSPAR